MPLGRYVEELHGLRILHAKAFRRDLKALARISLCQNN